MRKLYIEFYIIKDESFFLQKIENRKTSTPYIHFTC